ncbi:MAG TPA: hypothetical protein VFC18_04505, partial [Burkholderiales bacterium]|nr:hypothetical protein [Burkholderiales bacterium]
MQLRPLEALREEARGKRDAADRVVASHARTEYSLPHRLVWCGVEVLRHAWLNVYPLLALLIGVVFVFYVKQTREILAGMQQHWLVLGVLAAWAASIWYSMRVISGTDYPGDAGPHPASKGCTPWLTADLPRLAPFAGLVIVACAASIFLADGDPSPNWIAPLAAGVLPLTWAIGRLADGITRLVIDVRTRPVYRWSTLLVTLLAAVIASYTWSTVPQVQRTEPEALHFEDYLLALTVALTLVPLLLGRTGRAAHWAMAGALLVWLWVVYGTAQSHPGGSTLPFWILGVAAGLLWFTERRREVFGKQFRIMGDAAIPQKQIAGGTLAALAIAFSLQVALVVAVAYSPIALPMRLGTFALVFLALALVAFFGIVWVFVPKYATLPSLALVPVLWYLALGNTPNHTLRDSKFAREAPERPRLLEHFDRWRADLPGGEQAPIFFVSAAGGGLRAAYWTATMLAKADDQTCGAFGRHVYAYSGVSGGSLGLSVYLAQRRVWESKPLTERCRPGRQEEIARLLRRDFLAPVAASMLFAETAQRFVWFDYLDEDRGSVLARAWSAAWDDVFSGQQGRLDKPFLEEFSTKNGDATPAVFLNATAVKTGRRVIVSNVQVRLPDGVDLFRPVRLPVKEAAERKPGEPQETRPFALKTSGLPLREAVLNSARFTYVSPAGTVHACPNARADGACAADTQVWDFLVDGGYFENSGVATLSDVVRGLQIARERAIANRQELPAAPAKDRLFFIVIDNGAESQLACPPRARRNDGAAAVRVEATEGDGNQDALPGVA